MKSRVVGSLLALLVCVSLGSADLISPRKREEVADIRGGTVLSYSDGTFEALKPAKAIALGGGRSCLGLYVFDAHGNCVARDDFSTESRTADDVWVEWIPITRARYDIEMRNAGNESNEYQLAIR